MIVFLDIEKAEDKDNLISWFDDILWRWTIDEGLVVPIPIFPVLVNLNLSILFVAKIKWLLLILNKFPSLFVDLYIEIPKVDDELSVKLILISWFNDELYKLIDVKLFSTSIFVFWIVIKGVKNDGSVELFK